MSVFQKIFSVSQAHLTAMTKKLCPQTAVQAICGHEFERLDVVQSSSNSILPKISELKNSRSVISRP